MAKQVSQKKKLKNKNINRDDVVSLTSNRGEQKFCVLWEVQISLLTTLVMVVLKNNSRTSSHFHGNCILNHMRRT